MDKTNFHRSYNLFSEHLRHIYVFIWRSTHSNDNCESAFITVGCITHTIEWINQIFCIFLILHLFIRYKQIITQLGFWIFRYWYPMIFCGNNNKGAAYESAILVFRKSTMIRETWLLYREDIRKVHYYITVILNLCILQSIRKTPRNSPTMMFDPSSKYLLFPA